MSGYTPVIAVLTGLGYLTVATNDKDSLPDDSFFEQLMKMQGTRIEDQRSSLPGTQPSLVRISALCPDCF